jgi:TetR/AcrR family transcriptional regulator, tetracycline repressor protein
MTFAEDQDAVGELGSDGQDEAFADLHQQPGPLPPESERIATRHAALTATPAHRYPRAAAAASTLAGYISTPQYLWGLHRVLDGITTD